MIHFLLTPDKSASLALKRAVALQGARMDVAVGTWPELLTLAGTCHLLPPREDDWLRKLSAALRLQTDAFWSESLANVPAEEQSIVEVVGRHLAQLLEAAGPDGGLQSAEGASLPGRLARRVADFARLHAAMDFRLPPELSAVKAMLESGPERVLRTIRVYRRDDWPRLTPWQLALVTALNGRADAVADASLALSLEGVAATPAAHPRSLLHHFQSNLFASSAGRKPADDGVQWLGCRDYLQEAEIAAGMVRRAMEDDPLLICRDFALLLPADDRYRRAVGEVFAVAGIPLSGLGLESAGRDLGREAVHHFLLCKKGLAPAMVLASLLASPLMPWSAEEGNRLAQQVIGGDFRLRAPESAEVGQKVMLALIRKGVTTPAELAENLRGFLKQLRSLPYVEHPLNYPRQRSEQAVGDLVGKLASAAGLHSEELWQDLLHACAPQPVTVVGRAGGDLTREGVAVFHEGEEPWRGVRSLLVLGCCEGHYPAGGGRSPVFFDADLVSLREACGWSLESSVERGSRRREIFRRQLCSAAETVTMLVPRRDGVGKPLALSPALVFMASLLDGGTDAEGLVTELDSHEGRKRARGLARAADSPADPTWVPVAEDLELGADLVAVKAGAESPSRLETLMVSPLAWLLERLRVRPREWEPETLDVAAKGTLAHGVFERLFARSVPLPDGDEIRSRVPALLEEGMAGSCPYLARGEWKVEREHLTREITKAAARWGEILRELGAEVLATEVSLKGELRLGAQEALPVHGNADLLLALPGERLFVVDYKKSSGKGRRTRMRAGYDHQATLYRTMIETGGLEYPEQAPDGLADEIARHRESGKMRALYYLMNDQSVLTDSDDWLGGSFPGSPEMGSGIAREALPLIEKRIGEARRGRVELNGEGDGKEFKEKRGLGTYALDGTPLVRMFLKPAEPTVPC